jgi:hypothetical protein
VEGAEVVFLSWVAVEEAEVAIEVEVDHQMAIKIAVVDQLIRLRTSKVEFITLICIIGFLSALKFDNSAIFAN